MFGFCYYNFFELNKCLNRTQVDLVNNVFSVI